MANNLVAEWALAPSITSQPANHIKRVIYCNINANNSAPFLAQRTGRYYSRPHRYNRARRGVTLAKLRAVVTNPKRPLITKHVHGAELNAVAAYLRHVNYEYTTNEIERIEPALARVGEHWRKEEWTPVKVVHRVYASISDAQALHNLHHSLSDPLLVAFYPTLEHMRQGREVRTKLGKYLTTYAADFNLSETDIKTLVERHTANVRARSGWRVEFIEHDDPDGWVRVYSSPNVSSCMQGEDAVRVYAHEHSELRLAYLVDGNDDIIARCIVRDDPKGRSTGWLRVYPEPDNAAEGRFLLDYLTNNGYPDRINLNGALLQAIRSRYDNAYVCPYLDYGYNGDQTVSVVYRHGKDYLECGGGEIGAANTNGYTEEEGETCDCCGGHCSSEETTYVESSEQTVCESCLNYHFTYAYGRRSYQEYFPEEDCIHCESDGEYYVQDWASNHDVYQCEITNDWYKLDDLVSTSRGYVHVDEATLLDHEDSEGNNYAASSDVHELSDGTKCHEDDAERLQADIDAALIDEEQ